MIELVELILTHSLLDDFPALIIQHPLVRSFLHASSGVFVHLLAVYNPVTIALSSVSFGLVDVVYRFAVWTHGCLLLISLLYKLTRT